MDFINNLEDKVYELLKLKKQNKFEIYLNANLNHRLLEFPKKQGEKPEKTIEAIANTAETFLSENGFKISNKVEYNDTPYKSKCMSIEKDGSYYALIIGAKQEGDMYKISIIHTDFSNKN